MHWSNVLMLLSIARARQMQLRNAAVFCLSPTAATVGAAKSRFTDKFGSQRAILLRQGCKNPTDRAEAPAISSSKDPNNVFSARLQNAYCARGAIRPPAP